MAERTDQSSEILPPMGAARPRPEDAGARSFPEVLDAELDAVRASRRLRNGPTEDEPPFEGDSAAERAEAARLSALAFSGGGIRSATFNLGVAQGLARLGLLRTFDYLSINSGGGYIGGWLLAWIRRAGLDRVERELRTDTCDDGEEGGAAGSPAAERDGSPEAAPVSFLRRFSNYLTPRVGAFSADTWTMITTYARNLLLNQAVLVLALGAILLVPRFLVLTSHAFEGAWAGWPLVWGAVALAVAVAFIGLNQFSVLREALERDRKLPWFVAQRSVQWTVLLPLFASAWFTGLWMWYSEAATHFFLAEWLARHWPGMLEGWSPGELAEPVAWGLLAALVYFVVWLAGLPVHLVSIAVRRRWDILADARVRRLWLAVVAFALPAGAVGGVLLWAVASGSAGLEEVFQPMGYGEHESPWHLLHVNVWKAPAIVLVFMLTAFVHTGLMGRAFPEALRQWWSRLGAWLLIWTLTWLGVALIGLFGAILVVILGLWVASAVGSGWVLSTVTGVLVGRQESREAERPPWWRRLIVALAPQVFIVGLLVLVSLGVHMVLAPPAEELPGACQDSGFWLDPQASAETAPEESGLLAAGRIGEIVRCHSARSHQGTTWSRVLLLFALLGGGALGLSARVDINEFSMHLFYRNRLIRAFLGASNRRRRAFPFTGFDPADDLPLAHLAPGRPGAAEGENAEGFDGPYPLLNIALNLVAGTELAWQERKATSFVFAPLYSGFDVRAAPDGEPDPRGRLADSGFRPTAGYVQTSDGITLGTAMAISGAAASPSMGAGTTPSMAFLLTVFNVRLGWWLGNPRHEGTWSAMGPRVGLAALLSELFGFTGQDSRYVYLSDGGHFDNLALYELIRRRCRFIVLSDAGADPETTFEDLGNAIRKCCTDFGVEVDLDLTRFRRDGETGFSPWHCAVGTIRYDKVDPEAEPGVLIYVKASLNGDEPPDVLNYAAENPDFPHESTGDQWFGESQFESYRKLGEHVALTVFGAAAGESPARPEALFTRIRDAWTPRDSTREEIRVSEE